MKKALFFCMVALLLAACRQGRPVEGNADGMALQYATNLTLEQGDHYTVARLSNPWKKGATLQTYILLDSTLAEAPDDAPDGTVVHIPLKRSIVFTTAHASLLQMLGCEGSIGGVADAQYMLLPFIHEGIARQTIADCGNSMQPNVERIIAAKADALLLSPFEGSSFGALEKAGVPIIQCADYMETSALGRAEWMQFYGLLFGREEKADSLFKVVEKNYNTLKTKAQRSSQTLSVLADRWVSGTWYVPGGRSSVGLLYRDAGARYAYAADEHSGSLSLGFETILEKFGQADLWLLSYQGTMTLKTLLSEYHGYEMLKPYRTGEVYGVKVDAVPYFEQVSWRPDWLLSDYVQLFHPDLRTGQLRYYRKIE